MGCLFNSQNPNILFNNLSHIGGIFLIAIQIFNDNLEDPSGMTRKDENRASNIPDHNDFLQKSYRDQIIQDLTSILFIRIPSL
jgi:hypothetical protein